MPARSRGFTLIELLVVLVIVSIISAAAVLSLGALGGSSPAKHTAEQLAALTDLAAQQAVMQGRQYGLRVSPHAYEFLLYDGNGWSLVQDDNLLRARQLGNGVSLSLQLEGTAVILPENNNKNGTDSSNNDGSGKQAIKPQIMLLSSGEITPFQITVSASVSSVQYRVQGDLLHGIRFLPPHPPTGR